jgi:hypothetical protein
MPAPSTPTPGRSATLRPDDEHELRGLDRERHPAAVLDARNGEAEHDDDVRDRRER